MTGDLSITRPLDEVTAAHLDRTFEDRIGPDRDLVCRIHALQHAVTLRPMRVHVHADGIDRDQSDEVGEVLVVAARLEAYLRGEYPATPAEVAAMAAVDAKIDGTDGARSLAALLARYQARTEPRRAVR